MKRGLNDEDIRCVLPHRHDMLLLTNADVTPEDSTGRSLLRIGRGPAWWSGLACPHLYLAEALAQLSGVTLAWLGKDGPSVGVIGFLAEFPEMTLRGEIRDGDEVWLTTTVEMSFGPLVRFAIRAERDGEVLLTGSLSISVG